LQNYIYIQVSPTDIQERSATLKNNSIHT